MKNKTLFGKITKMYYLVTHAHKHANINRMKNEVTEEQISQKNYSYL